MNVLVIDHEDSFVYNLVQTLGSTGARVRCVRYTETLSTALDPVPDAVVLSPGPGHPSERALTRLSRSVLRETGTSTPILGVCLGHQLIAEVFGARVIRAPAPVHGATSPVRHRGEGLYRGIPNPFEAARYHSLLVDPRSIPAVLEVDARSSSGAVMGLHHRRQPTFGVQFHPESYLTGSGPLLLQNFLGEARR
ncbi:MAG TPA: aminodeoxychorismate/anthranilate synthase component II [Thermoplasmata archaeon]|nr:aminodeoxychorismate/anthranilate synthase component II [Thermoplasmata archaeon]